MDLLWNFFKLQCLPCGFNSFQQPLKVGKLHVTPGIPVILEDVNNLPFLALSIVQQHFSLIGNVRAFGLEFIVLTEPAIYRSEVAPGRNSAHYHMFQFFSHGQYPHNPDWLAS